jgi:hypothetical protein
VTATAGAAPASASTADVVASSLIAVQTQPPVGLPVAVAPRRTRNYR